MDIGTAKPSPDSLARFPHHLVNVADPSEQFTAGRFVKDAEHQVRAITARGRVPVISGGTAFYITSFLYGLPEAPAAAPDVRARLKEIERRDGQAALFRMLTDRDPEAAARIQPNDRYRTMRALEVLDATGRSLFSFAWPRTPRPEYRFLIVGLSRPREELYRRIEARVDRMFREGLVGEVARLLAMGYGREAPGMRGIGYRELLGMRTGCTTIGDARAQIQRNSRRYAKRQLTFFRAVPGVQWMDPEDLGALRERIQRFLAEALAEAT
jgi:tRNA dimethylallyltransferase